MTYSPEMTPSAGEPAQTEPSSARRGLGCALEIVETLVLTLIIYLLIHNFVAQPFEVDQSSMIPTITQSEYVLIDKISPRFDDYRRGDIVVFQPPGGFGQGGIPFIKRVIGLPGDTVSLRNGRVYVTPAGGSAVRFEEPYVVLGIDGTTAPTLPRDAQGTDSWVIPDGSYFVMGDNRPVSQDSRFFGPITRDLIIGRAWLRYFPLDRIGFLEQPTYAGLSDTPASTPAAWLSGDRRFGSSATTQVSLSRW